MKVYCIHAYLQVQDTPSQRKASLWFATSMTAEFLSNIIVLLKTEAVSNFLQCCYGLSQWYLSI